MALFKLVAQERSEFGKGAARRARREGLVPAVVYGQGGVASHVAVDAHELQLALRDAKGIIEISVAGKTLSCAAKDVQRDYIRNSVKHVDLVVLTPTEVSARSAS